LAVTHTVREQRAHFHPRILGDPAPGPATGALWCTLSDAAEAAQHELPPANVNGGW
jgi:hypothetical protein